MLCLSRALLLACCAALQVARLPAAGCGECVAVRAAAGVLTACSCCLSVNSPHAVCFHAMCWLPAAQAARRCRRCCRSAGCLITSSVSCWCSCVFTLRSLLPISCAAFCRLRADLLLGVASVSLSALLQECWVDGYAPVYAMMARADGGDERQEQVQVGYKWPAGEAPLSMCLSVCVPLALRA